MYAMYLGILSQLSILTAFRNKLTCLLDLSWNYNIVLQALNEENWEGQKRKTSYETPKNEMI
jgi:hypothetical protein